MMRTTQRIAPNQIQLAAEMIRNGQTVAFPTETVYGLGADALNAQAVERIFLAKGRPSDNPLIAHVASVEQLPAISEHVSPIANILIERFWPGPLTIVVPKSIHVPDNVTAGLPTVAVRMPQEPLALDLIRLADRPIVAPSANRSGRPSATTWESVLEDLDGRIDGVICGPQTRIGLESTVVDTTTDRPILLRHGAITEEMIAEVCGEITASVPENSELRGRSPGTRHRHYQPRARVLLADNLNQIQPRGERLGMIGLANSKDAPSLAERLKSRFPLANILLCDSLEQYANRLFEFFRECDAIGVDTLYCQSVERKGLGRAIMDRLDRAAE